MLRFPINWTLKDMHVSYQKNGECVSELLLNDEFRIVCLWERIQPQGLKPSIIQLRKKNMVEETVVFGSLSLSCIIGGSMTMQIIRKFSKIIRSGFPRLDIDFKDLPDPISFCCPHYSLVGDINIISISQICASDLENSKLKKGDDLKSLVQLSSDFESLLNVETRCFSDVLIKCDSVTIPADKNILSVRSPVFAAMFQNEMKENQENKVEIGDIDVSVLLNMLSHIYTGKTKNLTTLSASELLYAADKYQLQDLKRACCDFLKENISLENVLRILVLGDLHAEDLKSSAIHFICNKLPQFSVLENTEDWKTMGKERSALAMEVMSSVVNARDGK